MWRWLSRISYFNKPLNSVAHFSLYTSEGYLVLKPIMSSEQNQAPSASPVTWQTAFWLLVPLAINVMTQPCGRICGLPSRYRIFLRCSPIICCADGLSICLRMITYSVSLRLSPARALNLLLRDRLGHNAPENSSLENLKALRGQTFLRWSFFILGGFFPAVKLAALGGVPFTKAWGLMFFCSFLLVELIVVFSWHLDDVAADELSNQHEYSTARVEKFLFYGAFGAHVMVILYALSEVWPIPDTSLDIDRRVASLLPMEIDMIILSILATYLVYGFIAYSGSGILLCFGCFEDMRYPSRRFMFACLILFTLPMFWLMFGNMILVWICIDSGLIVLIFSPLWWFVLLCKLMNSRFSSVGSNLSLMRGTESDDVDIWGCYCLLFFLYTLITAVVWYAYGYDSTGTSNPGWTAIFG